MNIWRSIKAKLEQIVPEKRLFIRTDTTTRFVRLSPETQIFAGCLVTLFTAWTILSTAIFLMDSIGSGNFRHQAERDHQLYEERITALAAERDQRALEAKSAHERFNAALAQVSNMQSELLSAEERVKELERGLDVVQANLGRTRTDKEDALAELAALQGTLSENGGKMPEAAALHETQDTLAYLADALYATAQARDTANENELDAQEDYAALDRQMQELELRTDEIFRQLEDAMTISVSPLDRMFKNAGLNPTSLLDEVRRGYSGQGGALSPISFSTRGTEPSRDETRANEVLKQLDRLNVYRIAASRAPFAMPVKGNFRYTSGFGPRWGRMHNGTDFAGPHGLPIYATADGVVTKAGWSSSYGRVVYIKHAYGIETRYAHQSRLRVQVGQRVSRGQHIGDMGNSGRSTGTHLHYEVRVNGRPVNPMIYIKAAQNVF